MIIQHMVARVEILKTKRLDHEYELIFVIINTNGGTIQTNSYVWFDGRWQFQGFLHRNTMKHSEVCSNN